METREELRLYAGVEYHLLYNRYPPAKYSFVKPAFEAVKALRDGEPERLIEIPEDRFVKAEALIDLFRLDFYTECEVEE
jgi:hypothetical protein